MYCTKCGTVLQDGAGFCRSCGQPVGGAPTVTPESSAIPVPPPVTPPIETTIPPISPPPVASYAPPVVSAGSVPAVSYAGFWLRVVAYLIDGAVMGVVFGVVIAIMVATVGVGFFRGLAPGLYGRGSTVSYEVNSAWFPAAALGIFLILIPLTIVVTWLYFALMETSVHQGTLGKMTLGLFVTDLEGRRISFGRATGRFFAKIITGLVPLFIGYIMAGFTAKRQALHDMIAGCLVLKKV
jgi:uncharacterized RDD family membrane protein YckC